MAYTAQHKYRPRVLNDQQPLVHVVCDETKRARLRRELTRQRASLLSDWNLSLGLPTEQAPCADPADQASNDLAQDLAMQVRRRVIAKLKRIERALRLLRTKHYGRCRRCQKAIPYERLVVQPDALFCVSCLARMESRRERNEDGSYDVPREPVYPPISAPGSPTPTRSFRRRGQREL
jgi:RNA polymerase-binding transcription factor DksA